MPGYKGCGHHERWPELLDCIMVYKSDHGGLSPTYREIGKMMGITSVSTIAGYIDRMVRDGWLVIAAKEGKRRCYRLPDEP